MVCACRFIFAEKREMNDKQAKGQAGEQLAREYLQTNGYAILEANWKWGHLEVDIIAMKENTIVFVEVKTRSSDRMAPPEAAVNSQKQNNLFRAANTFVTRRGYNCEVRFDIISIVQSAEGTQLEHIPDAFIPRW